MLGSSEYWLAGRDRLLQLILDSVRSMSSLLTPHLSHGVKNLVPVVPNYLANNRPIHTVDAVPSAIQKEDTTARRWTLDDVPRRTRVGR